MPGGKWLVELALDCVGVPVMGCLPPDRSLTGHCPVSTCRPCQHRPVQGVAETKTLRVRCHAQQLQRLEVPVN